RRSGGSTSTDLAARAPEPAHRLHTQGAYAIRDCRFFRTALAAVAATADGFLQIASAILQARQLPHPVRPCAVPAQDATPAFLPTGASPRPVLWSRCAQLIPPTQFYSA